MAGGQSNRTSDGRAADDGRPKVGRARALFRRAFLGSSSSDISEFKDSGVGRLLCATRMRLGKDLQQIAQVLHIRYTYLVAIEDGRYEDLPGQAYALGFVRAYADHLELDGGEIVRRFKEESTGLRRKAALDFPIPTPDSGIPSGVALVMAVALGMAVYGAWYGLSKPARTFPLVQEVPSQLVPPKAETAETATAQQPPAAAEDTDEIASEAPPPPTTAGETAPAPMPPATAEGAEADQPADIAAASNDVVEVRAKVDSWIQIHKGEKLLLTKLLRKGDVYRPDQPGLTLMTGNAGGIELVINGEAMPPLGEPGTVASGVPLDAAKFKSAD